MKYAGVRWWNGRKGEGERERRGAETLDGEMGLWSKDLQEAGELVSSVPGDSTWGFRAQVGVYLAGVSDGGGSRAGGP